jgi:hypothetical protein
MPPADVVDPFTSGRNAGYIAGTNWSPTMKRNLSLRSLRATCLAVLALACALPALSHHSTANFDMTKKVTLTGTVSFFRFTSPHSHIDIEVPVEGGPPRIYKIFTVATTVMTRTGWKHTDVKVGDKVTVTGNPDRNDPTLLNLQQIVFTSGKTWNWDLVP